eukprot:5323936-Pleurochrysis_carterae.AAC.1
MGERRRSSSGAPSGQERCGKASRAITTVLFQLQSYSRSKRRSRELEDGTRREEELASGFAAHHFSAS